MSDLLQSLNCAQCGGTPLTDNGDGTISCPYCGSSFAHPERVCPACEAINEADAQRCASCGETLRKPCPGCGASNWVLAPYCQRCGVELSVLASIALRHAETTADRVRRFQAEAPLLKEEAERGSQERLEKMWALDHARMAAMAKAKAERQRQERIIWIIASVAVVLMIVGIVALTLITQLQPH